MINLFSKYTLTCMVQFLEVARRKLWHTDGSTHSPATSTSPSGQKQPMFCECSINYAKNEQLLLFEVVWNIPAEYIASCCHCQFLSISRKFLFPGLFSSSKSGEVFRLQRWPFPILMCEPWSIPALHSLVHSGESLSHVGGYAEPQVSYTFPPEHSSASCYETIE